MTHAAHSHADQCAGQFAALQSQYAAHHNSAALRNNAALRNSAAHHNSAAINQCQKIIGRLLSLPIKYTNGNGN